MTLPVQPAASPLSLARPALLAPTKPNARRLLRWSLLAGTAALLGGCAGFSPDGGMAPIQAAAYAEIGKGVVKIADDQIALTAKARVDQLLRKPLTADSAVQVALLSNRGLQASFNELGIAEAQMVAASLPPNPRFGISKLSGRLEVEIERQIVGSLLALITLPARAEIAGDRFKTAQLRAVEAVLRLAADARRQYYRAVAANAQVGFYQEAKASADAASELFKRLGESGGVNKIDQAREFAFEAELTVQLAQARQQQRQERERLVRQLGLWGDDLKFRLGNLPPLPRLQSVKAIEAEALRKRIDIQIARAELDTLAKSLGLANATRFVNDIDLLGRRTYDRSRSINDHGHIEREASRRKTLELEIDIPIYDFGQSKVALAEQTYMQAANKLAEKAVNARSEAREAYTAYRANYDITRQYQNNVLPLRKIILEQSLLQYSGMLNDVTDLITDARNRILSNVAAINARRDFWLAHTDFKHALIGGGSGGGGAATVAAAGGGDAGGGGH
ncbi:TolC family protein [Bosea sp. (in: a-proteobacteria)]|jgi:outer membrane protein TolC|uniref:TolC family protein n=1 Tax=Bosea sp. (in: a-proteobacteria) TaxID=1871050 RepID=UPI0025B866EF|nr:TolC family protein [Bosea sp. (in: a-proteobacteria)]MBR3189724.1 TolC family protein [Bosea sp. (in: a-proteobacteria)]